MAEPVGAGEVASLIDRFTAEVSRVLPLVALWAHGSLALGDFQLGRSDLDLVAVIATPIAARQRRDLQRVHEALRGREPLADKLHCAYVIRAVLADADRRHLTWAHGELLDRLVSPVSRRELRQGGLCLSGPPPADLLPAVGDQELADYIRRDLREFWYPRTGREELWLRDIWVDLGMLTLARATVTLTDGRLITKKEALDVLTAMAAPADVVRDIYQRRYETPPSAPEGWLARRGSLARAFVRAGIEGVLNIPGSP